MKQTTVVIADVLRTPWGKPGGSLEKLMSSDLAAAAIRALLARTGVEPEKVDQVVFGQAHPSTMPNNIGHYAWLKAELPVEVPGDTVQANSASALQALRCAYYLIATGNERIVVAGGADSYSCAPFVMRDVRNHFYPKDRVIIDTIDEAERRTQPKPMTREEQYALAHGDGETDEMRAFGRASREKAERFAGTIVPVSYTERKKGVITVGTDEYLASPEEGGALAPYADGCAAAMLMSEEEAAARGVAPLGELCGFAAAGADPERQQTAGALAVRKLLARRALSPADIAAFEIIENSAADVLETLAGIGGAGCVNPFGGALAYGKNDGAEGIAMLQRLTAALKPEEYGVLCIHSAGGLGMAALVRKR